MGSSYYITYGGNRLTFPGATGSVAWPSTTPAPAPFATVNSSLWIYTASTAWRSAIGTSTYATRSSQLYRKVNVLADVSISSYTINCFNTPTNKTTSTSWNATAYTSWSAISSILDSGYQQIGISSNDSLVLVDNSAYLDTAIHQVRYSYWHTIPCSADLSAGCYYWWPLIIVQSTNATKLGYFADTSGELLGLHRLDMTSTEDTYPPRYVTADYRIFLKLNDVSGNEWFV